MKKDIAGLVISILFLISITIMLIAGYATNKEGWCVENNIVAGVFTTMLIMMLLSCLKELKKKIKYVHTYENLQNNIND